MKKKILYSAVLSVFLTSCAHNPEYLEDTRIDEENITDHQQDGTSHLTKTIVFRNTVHSLLPLLSPVLNLSKKRTTVMFSHFLITKIRPQNYTMNTELFYSQKVLFWKNMREIIL